MGGVLPIRVLRWIHRAALSASAAPESAWQAAQLVRASCSLPGRTGGHSFDPFVPLSAVVEVEDMLLSRSAIVRNLIALCSL